MEKLANRFVLEREVGSGGMSTVYLGRDEVLGRSVAVKVLKGGFSDTDIGDRFQREGKTAASLSHPSIVPVYDAGEGEISGREVSYIVMEHVSGGDLKDLLDKRGPLGKKELSRIGAEVAAGLAHAHERGIIHRDIKPHNILLDEAGHPKLTDFGIARAMEATRFTQTGSYLGTALYSSPEQLLGKNVTTKSDVYSLGATLYQAATGTAPFQGAVMEVAEKHISEEPKPPSDFDPEVDGDLEKLILACLAKDPEKRPSAKEVSSRLMTLSVSPERKVAPAVASPTASEPRNSKNATRNAPRRDTPAPSSRKRAGRGAFVAVALVVLLAVAGLATIPSLLGGTGESASETPRQNEAPSGGQSEGESEGGAANEAPVESETADSETAEAPAPEEPPEPNSSESNASGSNSSGSGESASVEGASGGLSEGAASEAVEGFYVAAADGDYGLSDEYMSEGLRQSLFPDEGTFEGTFSTLESISFVEEPDVEISGSAATVSGTTEAIHTDRTELNTATWTLVDEGGEWKLDGITIENQEIV